MNAILHRQMVGYFFARLFVGAAHAFNALFSLAAQNTHDVAVAFDGSGDICRLAVHRFGKLAEHFVENGLRVRRTRRRHASVDVARRICHGVFQKSGGFLLVEARLVLFAFYDVLRRRRQLRDDFRARVFTHLGHIQQHVVIVFVVVEHHNGLAARARNQLVFAGLRKIVRQREHVELHAVLSIAVHGIVHTTVDGEIV